MTSDELLRLDARAGQHGRGRRRRIGCELASHLRRSGQQGDDHRDARAASARRGQARRAHVAASLSCKAGIEVRVGTTVEAMRAAARACVLSLAGGDQVSAARVLVSVGRRRAEPRARLRGGRRASSTAPASSSPTTRCARRVDGVFAAGDLAGPPLLAHWAYHEGAVAAENAVTGARLEVDRRIVPACVFSPPGGGQLRHHRGPGRGRRLGGRHGSLRFNGNAKAVIEAENDGYVRIVTERGSGVVLGALARRTQGHRAGARDRPGGATASAAAGDRRDDPRPSDPVGGDRRGGAGQLRSRVPLL